MGAIVSQLLANANCMDVYCKAQAEDPSCAQITSYSINGWPVKHTVKGQLKHYWQARHNLTIGEGLLQHQSHIVVPESQQHETLCKIHYGHQSI